MDTGVLKQIWDALPEGYVFLPRIKGWKPTPKGKLEAAEYIEGAALTKEQAIRALNVMPTEGVDIYFTPLTFNAPSRKKEYANPSRVLFADLDDCDPRNLPEALRPTTYWQSSEHHFQGMWLLDRELSLPEFEDINRRLSYAIGADKSGWDITQILRVPGSANHKRGNPDPCTLLHHSPHPAPVTKIVAALEAIPSKSPTETEWPIPKRALDLLSATEFPVGERSERLWELEKLLVEAELPLAEIFRLLEKSGWNKFADRRDGSTALLKDIMKAEAEYKVAKVSKPSSMAIAVESDDGLLDFATLVTADIPQPSFLVQDFVVAESVGVMAGEPKTMKSTVALDLAVAVASGKPFLGRYAIVDTCPVLYIQEENSAADIMSRLQRIALHHGVATADAGGVNVAAIPLYIMNNKGVNLTSENDQKILEQVIATKDVHLLVLDPWYMMVAGIDEDRSKEVSPVLKFLTHIRNDYHCTVILVHHFKKGQEVRAGQRMRGSSVFHAWVESGLYFSLNKGREGEVIIDREFRSFSPRPDVHLTFSNTDSGEYDVIVDDTVRVTTTTTATSSPMTPTVPVYSIGLTPDTLLMELDAGSDPEMVSAKYGVSTDDIQDVIVELVRKGKVAGKWDGSDTFEGLRRVCTTRGSSMT